MAGKTKILSKEFVLFVLSKCGMLFLKKNKNWVFLENLGSLRVPTYRIPSRLRTIFQFKRNLRKKFVCVYQLQIAIVPLKKNTLLTG